MWRLGAALESGGEEKEALDAYIASYDQEAQTQGKRFIIEMLYRKLNGNLDGLDKLIGVNPFADSKLYKDMAVAQDTEEKTTVEPTPTPTPTSTPNIPDEVPVSDIVKSKTDDSENQTKENVQPLSVEKVEDSTNNEADSLNKTKDVKENPDALIIKSESKDSANAQPSPTPETLNLKEDIPLIGATTSPTPEKTAADNKDAPNPSDEKPKIEDEAMQKQGEAKGAEAKSADSANPLFETIVIKIPKEQEEKDSKSDEKGSDTKLGESDENKKPESETKTDKDSESEKENEINMVRPRVVAKDKDVSEIPPSSEEIKPCKIEVSQESLALINDGGKVLILVSIEDDADLSKLKASTDSPKDIEIIFEPEISGASGQAIFIIKSISANMGEYKIIFEAPCGKKEVSVKVR